ncbi:KxYKxGKxW signal peptide domain-containing protein [Weissella confusa]|uniref:KxYKxGKxW signal peptide domain-containing protein n=1 Tax=Weissella confusa TaxID=1583 RepID=UPI00107F9001|nr:KxYKxGKxW signal peptide domain-containing protein [Weissella confusa]
MFGKMQNRGEQNVHFKMYKDGKRWVTRGLVLGAVGLMVVAPIATTNLQLTHVKNVVAATTGRSLTQNEQAQIDRLQSVIDGYRFVQELAGTDAVWQGNLSGAISKAMDMIQTIKSGDYTQANGSYSDGMPFADQQIQFQVDRVEDYALAIEVAYIREHNANWYAKVTRGEVFPDITTDYLNSLASGAQDGFQWMKHYLLEIVNGYLNETGKTTVGGADKPVTSNKPATSSAADNGTTSSTTNSGSSSDDQAAGNGSSTGSNSSSAVDNGTASSTTNPGSSSDDQTAGNGSSTGSNSSSAVDNGTASSTTNSGSSSSDDQAAGNGSTGSNSSVVDNGSASSTTNSGSSSDDQAAGNGSSTGSNSSAVDNGTASSTTNSGSSSDDQATGNGSTGSNSSSADNGTTSSTTNSSSVASSVANEQVVGSDSATSNSSAVDNGAASSMTNSRSVASSAATVRVAGNDSMNVVVNTPASVAPSATTGAVMNLASTATTNASTNNATTNANVVNGVSTVNNQTSASAASAATVASSAPVSGSNVNRINDTVESTTPQALKLHASDDRQFDTLERSHVTETFLSVIIALIAALMYKLLRNNKRDEADDVLAEEDERLFSDVKKISKINK